MTTVISRNNKYKQHKRETKKKTQYRLHTHVYTMCCFAEFLCRCSQYALVQTCSSHQLSSVQFTLFRSFAISIYLFIILCEMHSPLSLSTSLFLVSISFLFSKFTYFTQISKFHVNLCIYQQICFSQTQIYLYFSQTQIYLTKIP